MTEAANKSSHLDRRRPPRSLSPTILIAALRLLSKEQWPAGVQGAKTCAETIPCAQTISGDEV